MNVLFAPDWRSGNAYQALLADNLRASEIEVDFLDEYRRVFPLWRGIRHRDQCALLHLHWPEAYFSGFTPLQRLARPMKFIPDLFLTTRHRPLVLTAHNRLAHDRRGEFLARLNSRYAYSRAAAVIAHSETAKRELVQRLDLAPEKCHVIPHGDPSATLGSPVAASEARKALDLPDGPLCLMFGAVKPYKGIEEVLDFWATVRPSAMLAIVGHADSSAYEQKLARLANRATGVITRFQWLEDHELAQWLSAADCAVFNYRNILTSGGACLARSFGVPILIPTRLDTVDLDEPHPLVHRFDTLEGDFPAMLAKALTSPPDFAAAREWREKTAWSLVAKKTADVYRDVLAAHPTTGRRHG